MTTATKKTKKKIVILSRPFVVQGKTYHGRLPNGRISLNQKENQLCLEMIRKGFSQQTIAATLKLTKAQVALRGRIAGVYVTDYRNGKGQEAKEILSKYQVVYKNR